MEETGDVLRHLSYVAGQRFAFAVEHELQRLEVVPIASTSNACTALVFPPLRERYFSLLAALCTRHSLRCEGEVDAQGQKIAVVQRTSGTQLEGVPVQLSDFFCDGFVEPPPLARNTALDEPCATYCDDFNCDVLPLLYDYSKYTAKRRASGPRRQAYIYCDSKSPSTDTGGFARHPSWELQFGNHDTPKTLGLRFSLDAGPAAVRCQIGSERKLWILLSQKEGGELWDIALFISDSGHNVLHASTNGVVSKQGTFWLTVTRQLPCGMEVLVGTGAFPNSSVLHWDSPTETLQPIVPVSFAYGQGLRHLVKGPMTTRDFAIRGIGTLGTCVPPRDLPRRSHIIQLRCTPTPTTSDVSHREPKLDVPVPGVFRFERRVQDPATDPSVVKAEDLQEPQHAISSYLEQMLSSLFDDTDSSHIRALVHQATRRIVWADRSKGTLLLICRSVWWSARLLVLLHLKARETTVRAPSHVRNVIGGCGPGVTCEVSSFLTIPNPALESQLEAMSQKTLDSAVSNAPLHPNPAVPLSSLPAMSPLKTFLAPQYSPSPNDASTTQRAARGDDRLAARTDCPNGTAQCDVWRTLDRLVPASSSSAWYFCLGWVPEAECLATLNSSRGRKCLTEEWVQWLRVADTWCPEAHRLLAFHIHYACGVAARQRARELPPGGITAAAGRLLRAALQAGPRRSRD